MTLVIDHLRAPPQTGNAVYKGSAPFAVMREREERIVHILLLFLDFLLFPDIRAFSRDKIK